jgi:phage terminase large subunit-like protein
MVDLNRWRADPIGFIESVLVDPESGRPFVLLPAEREFLKHAFERDDTGRLKYPERVYSCPKKSGKTTFAALVVITIVVLFGGGFPEAICCANAFEQAQGRVFAMIKRIIEASPLLKREAKIAEARITLADAQILAIPSDAGTAAGANPVISVFDELWGYDTERARRLFDEMVPPPTRKIACRLVVSYAGFSGQSELLEELYKRGLQLPQVGPDLYAGDGMLMFWTHAPVAPWQTESWLAEMRRSLRPNQYLRLAENRFVSGESSFVSMAAWDRCIDPRLGPAINNKTLGIYVGVDASVRHDQTAICAVSFDKKSQLTRLVFHRVYQPAPDNPLDFEHTVERTLLDLKQRFQLRKVLFDPYQMQATAQRLLKANVPVEEFPQSVPNITAASQNLFELIQSQALIAYPDAELRLAVSRAVAVESSRGWKISKATASHKIDLVVALAMACYAAVQGQGEPAYLLWALAGEDDPAPSPAMDEYRRRRFEMEDQWLARYRMAPPPLILPGSRYDTSTQAKEPSNARRSD